LQQDAAAGIIASRHREDAVGTGADKFQILWFSGLTLGMSVLAIWKGSRIAWRRELDNPIVPLRGGRAVALGAFVAAVGILGVALAVLEGMKLRG
jgi:hypothetical protein